MDLPLHGRTPVQPGQDLSLTGLARVVEDFCAAMDLSGVDLVANDTGGAVAQIVAAHQPQRLASFTLTNCETLGNVRPWAFKPAVLAARAGLMAPLSGPRLLRNLPGSRKRRFGIGYQDVTSLPLEVVRAYLEPLAGTKERAREFQRWVASLHNRDLAAVEPATRKAHGADADGLGNRGYIFPATARRATARHDPGRHRGGDGRRRPALLSRRTRRRPDHPLARVLGRAPRQRRPGLGHPLAR